jgi:hypothetical protein
MVSNFKKKSTEELLEMDEFSKESRFKDEKRWLHVFEMFEREWKEVVRKGKNRISFRV